MAKTDALNIFQTDESTKDKLTESYAELMDMIQQEALSTQLKNTNLSGDPESGSIVCRRLKTSSSETYGTARTAGEGDQINDNGVTINVDTNKEIVEELELKDIELYGIDGILGKRQANHVKAFTRDIDSAFFTEAEAEGSEVTLGTSDIEDQLEELIQEVETTQNDNVDGVDRDMLVLTVKPSVYGALRNYVDTLPNPMGGGVDARFFHDVRVYPNLRQTKDAICMAVGSVGQLVKVSPYKLDNIPLSDAVAVTLFYYYGTKAVMPDLIQYADTGSIVSA